jgi:hypothetical protein
MTEKSDSTLSALFHASYNLWSVVSAATAIITLIFLPRQYFWIVPWLLLIGLVYAGVKAVGYVRSQKDKELLKLRTEKDSEIARIKEISKNETTSLTEMFNRLRAENDKLRVKPYDAELEMTVREKLKTYSVIQRDFLRFLLLRGETAGLAIGAAAADKGSDLSTALGQLQSHGVVETWTDSGSGRFIFRDTHFRVNTKWEQVLRDLLFPRQETEPTPRFTV